MESALYHTIRLVGTGYDYHVEFDCGGVRKQWMQGHIMNW